MHRERCSQRVNVNAHSKLSTSFHMLHVFAQLHLTVNSGSVLQPCGHDLRWFLAQKQQNWRRVTLAGRRPLPHTWKWCEEFANSSHQLRARESVCRTRNQMQQQQQHSYTCISRNSWKSWSRSLMNDGEKVIAYTITGAKTLHKVKVTRYRSRTT